GGEEEDSDEEDGGERRRHEELGGRWRGGRSLPVTLGVARRTLVGGRGGSRRGSVTSQRGVSMPAASRAALMRARSSRATRHCSSGRVWTTRRIFMLWAPSSSSPHTSGSERIESRQPSACHIESAV